MRAYNLFPLLAGQFKDWEPHLARASDIGFDWIFVNPIQKSGNSGSLYSIADYFELDPRLVDTTSKDSPERQAKSAIEKAEKLGLKVMVDLVINHCAVDSPLLQQYPQWFAHAPDGNVAHPFCVEDGREVVWYDLARFDHAHTSDPEGLHKYIFGIVEYLLKLGFKAFRCDAAYQIPRHVWHRLIEEVKSKHPETLFAAETLGCTADQTKETAQAGFDYVFNSSKWWDFGSPWLLEQYHLVRDTVRSISFPESHDTERLFAEMHGNVDALKQRYLFSALFSSAVMMPMGYEFGFRRKLHVVETRPQDWEETEVDLSDFIRKVNELKAQYDIFQEECPTNIIGYDNPGILLMWKASSKSPGEALLVLNKDPWNRNHFYADNLATFVQAGAPLKDVSPDNPLEYLAVPYDYDLPPGHGRVMVTERDFGG